LFKFAFGWANSLALELHRGNQVDEQPNGRDINASIPDGIPEKQGAGN